MTGLSRSGKTVFITSLIHNLLSSLHNPNRMPLLNVVGERRLFAAHLEAPRAAGCRNSLSRQYPEDGRSGSAGAHRRSQRYRHRSALRAANAVGRLLSEITGNPANLTIRIVDYPGEWLLDLPLLEQSYADWSRATLQLLRKGVRAGSATSFSAFSGCIGPGTPPAKRWRSRRMTSIAAICSPPATAAA